MGDGRISLNSPDATGILGTAWAAKHPTHCRCLFPTPQHTVPPLSTQWLFLQSPQPTQRPHPQLDGQIGVGVTVKAPDHLYERRTGSGALGLGFVLATPGCMVPHRYAVARRCRSELLCQAKGRTSRAMILQQFNQTGGDNSFPPSWNSPVS